MPDDDVQKDHLSEHLGELNLSNQVLASEDIRNQHGSLIIRKGQPITRKVAKRLAVHKLLKPVYASINLAHTYDGRKMYTCLETRLLELGFADAIQRLNLHIDVRAQFNNVCSYPIINLKLTILAQRFPKIFVRVLTCAFMALSIARELKLTEEMSSNIFIATMLTEVGLLHINPELANKTGAFTVSEWRMYQGHAGIAKAFADHVPSLPKQVGIAILEHHERNDGFGYPFNKKGNQLGIEGRVLAITSTISAVYRKHVVEQGRSFSVITPVLQFNPAVNSKLVNNATLRLLDKAQISKTHIINRQRTLRLIPRLLGLAEDLNHWVSRTEILAQLHSQELSPAKYDAHRELYEQLLNILDTSGLLSSHQQEWLKKVAVSKEESEFPAVEHFAVMLFEAKYQCQQVHRFFISLLPKSYKGTVKFKVWNEELQQFLK